MPKDSFPDEVRYLGLGASRKTVTMDSLKVLALHLGDLFDNNHETYLLKINSSFYSFIHLLLNNNSVFVCQSAVVTYRNSH